MFKRTTAVNKIGAMKARKRVIQGGTSASKTYSILAILINKALKTNNLEISVVAESIPHLRRGALKDFVKIMVWIERFEEDCFNKSTLTYRFSNGSYIEFFSADQPDKLRGARRNILYVNEANNIDFESYYQLAIRTSDVIYIDFNPTVEFWAHTEVLKEEDSEFLKLNYLDNEALPETIVREIEQNKEKAKTSDYWANWWQVYGLGEVGQQQELVFPPFEVVSERPERFQKYVYGLDFGYQHPSAMVKVYYCEEELYVEEVIYKQFITDLPMELEQKQIEKNVEIICDSARPDLVSILARAGYYTLKADKRVEKGLDAVRKCKVYIHESARNTIAENRKYKYKKINGVLTETIDKTNDDAMDALRYAALYIFNNYTNYTPLMTY
jgi:phage terminase large subunit